MTKSFVYLILIGLSALLACEDDTQVVSTMFANNIGNNAPNVRANKIIAMQTKKFAGYTEERKLMNQSSLKYGVGRKSVKGYRRKKGPGMKIVKGTIVTELKKINSKGLDLDDIKKESVSQENKLFVSGKKDWYLEIWPDGTKGRYANWKYVDENKESYREIENRIPLNQLIPLAENFIKNALSQTIKIKSNERLVPYQVRRQIETLVSDDPSESFDKISANTVYFTRAIDEIPVLGAGSKTSITIANDGEIIGFSFDWPEYVETGSTIGTVDVEEIFERTSVLGTNFEDSDETELQHFECGLVDVGLLEDQKKPNAQIMLQPGCMATFKGNRTNLDNESNDMVEMVQSKTVFVPAGLDIIESEVWPETVFLQSYLNQCLVSSISESLPIQRLGSQNQGEI